MIDVHHVDACPSKITVFLGSVNCEADAAVYPCDATDQHIEWYSDDPGIAAVNPETGYISGVSLGRTKIYAQATNGSRAGIVVEVVPAMIEEIFLESSHKTIGVGKKIVLRAYIVPETARGREILWGCTDSNVLTLTTDGYQVSVETNMLGNAVITATAVGHYPVRDCCGVNVVETDGEDSNFVDNREIVVVKEDTSGAFDFFDVEFPDGLTWKSIGKDLTNADAIIDRECLERYNYNIGCHDPQCNNSECNNPENKRTYTPEQLAFLYMLDPIGVAYFLKHYNLHHKEEMYKYIQLPDDETYENGNNHWLDLSKTMQNVAVCAYFKDYIYELIAGRKPKYFTVDDQGELHYANLTEGRYFVFSEAELVFGGHPIADSDKIDMYINKLIQDCYMKIFNKIHGTEKLWEKVTAVCEIAQLILCSESVVNFVHEFSEWAISLFIEKSIEAAIESNSPIASLAFLYVLSKKFEAAAGIIDDIYQFIPEDMKAICQKIDGHPQYKVQFSIRSKEFFLRDIVNALE